MRRVLRRVRPAQLFAAAAVTAVTAVLMAGLVHDFKTPEAGGRWLTPRPALAGALLVLGFACMLAHSLAGEAGD